jgi:hypothetical protein
MANRAERIRDVARVAVRKARILICMTSDASVALVRKYLEEMVHVWIAIRIQTALVRVIKTKVVPKVKVVPRSVIASSQVRFHTDHIGSAQDTTDVSMTETAEVSALNPAQSADMSAKASDMTSAETSYMASAETSYMASAKASHMATTKASSARRRVGVHQTAGQCCGDQESYHSS